MLVFLHSGEARPQTYARHIMIRDLRLFTIVVAASALAALVPAPAAAVTPDQLRTCDSKEEIGNDQRIASCTAIINDAATSMPQKANAFANRGKAYRAKGNAAAALRDLDQAIQLDPNNGEAFYNRGSIFRERGENDKALQDLELAVEYDKRNANALSTLSHIYYDRRDYTRAINVLNEAIKLNPNFGLALYNRGMAYRAKGEPDRAIPDYDRAIKAQSQRSLRLPQPGSRLPRHS
jgi:tetratricopeptide (TPR) repeat protein